MNLPNTTCAEIQSGNEYDFVGRVISVRTFDDGNRQLRLEGLEGRRISLKVWDGDAPRLSVEHDSWYLLKDVAGDKYNGSVRLSSNFGEMSVQSIEKPSELITKVRYSDGGTKSESAENSEDTWGAQTPKTGYDGRPDAVFLDIETITTVPEERFDFNDSSHLEILCVGVGYTEHIGTHGRIEVFFRTGPSARAEYRLLENVVEFIETRAPDRTVMFKGDFDRQHLIGRAAEYEEIDDSIQDRMEAIFEGPSVLNITPAGSLEDNADVGSTYWTAYEHDLDPAEWRRGHPRYDGPLGDPKVYNLDIPYFGERSLETWVHDPDDPTARGLRALLRDYSRGDIRPLFELV